MKVLLLDLDGKLPNLALMKLSAWHKAQGHEVFLNYCPKPDKVYGSAMFTWSTKVVEQAKKLYPGIELGGTGIDLSKELPAEIEVCKPDYDLYTVEEVYKRIKGGIRKKATTLEKARVIVDAGIGFTARGCRRSCAFCCVPRKEGCLHQVAGIGDLLNPQSNVLVLLDNNLTADPLVIEKLHEIRDRRLVVDISQGIDVRVLTPEIVEALGQVRHLRLLHYAWDLMGFERQVIEGIRLLKRKFSGRNQMCFMLVGYDTTFEEDMYRFQKLREEGVNPYVHVYNHVGTPQLRHFARWVNGHLFKACVWDEYLPWVREQGQACVQMAI